MSVEIESSESHLFLTLKTLEVQFRETTDTECLKGFYSPNSKYWIELSPPTPPAPFD